MPECLRDVVDEMVDWITAPAWVWLYRLAACCQGLRPCLCGCGGPAAADLRARADRRLAIAMARWDAEAAAARAQEEARLAGYGLPALAADPQLGGVVGAFVARFQRAPGHLPCKPGRMGSGTSVCRTVSPRAVALRGLSRPLGRARPQPPRCHWPCAMAPTPGTRPGCCCRTWLSYPCEQPPAHDHQGSDSPLGGPPENWTPCRATRVPPKSRAKAPGAPSDSPGGPPWVLLPPPSPMYARQPFWCFKYVRALESRHRRQRCRGWGDGSGGGACARRRHPAATGPWGLRALELRPLRGPVDSRPANSTGGRRPRGAARAGAPRVPELQPVRLCLGRPPASGQPHRRRANGPARGDTARGRTEPRTCGTNNNGSTTRGGGNRGNRSSCSRHRVPSGARPGVPGVTCIGRPHGSHGVGASAWSCGGAGNGGFSDPPRRQLSEAARGRTGRP